MARCRNVIGPLLRSISREPWPPFRASRKGFWTSSRISSTRCAAIEIPPRPGRPGSGIYNAIFRGIWGTGSPQRDTRRIHGSGERDSVQGCRPDRYRSPAPFFGCLCPLPAATKSDLPSNSGRDRQLLKRRLPGGDGTIHGDRRHRGPRTGQPADEMMTALACTAPGTAEMIGAQAGAWVVRSQAYARQALAGE